MVDGGARRVAVLQARHLVGRQREDVRDVAGLPVAHLDAERRHEDEPAEAFAALDRHLRGDPAAQRRADHDHVAEIPLGEQVEVEIREIVDGVDGARVGRVPEAGV